MRKAGPDLRLHSALQFKYCDSIRSQKKCNHRENLKSHETSVCVPEILSRPVTQYELLPDDLSLKSSLSAEITRVPEREMSFITWKVLNPVTECNILRLQFPEDLHGIHREMKLNRCHEIQLRKNVT